MGVGRRIAGVRRARRVGVGCLPPGRPGGAPVGVRWPPVPHRAPQVASARVPAQSEPATQPAANPASTPPPAGVPGNRWTAIAVAEIGALSPSARVSVVISGDDPDDRLALTLAAVARQTYPASLTEVVVATDSASGEAALRAAASGVDLRLDAPRGSGAAGGGADAARGDVLIFLPAGALPDSTLIEAHARWHHAVQDAVSSGISRRIDARALQAADVERAARAGDLEGLVAPCLSGERADEDTLDAYLESTRDLTEWRPDLFRVAAQASVSMRAETYREAGGAGDVADERLARLDLAYRLDCLGCVFVPERAARTFDHYPDAAVAAQGAAGSAGQDVAPASADQRVGGLIPAVGFRPRGTGRVFARPAMVVNVAVGEEGAAEILGTVDAVLRGRFQDLELRLTVAADHPEHHLIEEACAADPRIVLGPPSAEGRTECAHQVTLPAIAVPDDRTFEDIQELMTEEGMGALHVTVPGELPRRAMVEAVATGPLARARRVAAVDGEEPEAVLGRLFGERWVSGVEVSIRRRGAAEPQVTEHGPLAPATDLEHERTQHLRHSSRAATNQAKADRYAKRAARERLRAREERQRAERLEAEIARRQASRLYALLRPLRRIAALVRSRIRR